MDMEAVKQYDDVVDDQFTTMLRDHVCPTGACQPNDTTGRMCANCFDHCVPPTAMVVVDDTVGYATPNLKEEVVRLEDLVRMYNGLLEKGKKAFASSTKCFEEALAAHKKVIAAERANSDTWESMYHKKDEQLQAALAELAKK
jgi:hypothetical protein